MKSYKFKNADYNKMKKQKISITLDNKMLKIIENILKDARFRNRSHVIEYSLKKFLEKDLDNNINGGGK